MWLLLFVGKRTFSANPPPVRCAGFSSVLTSQNAFFLADDPAYKSTNSLFQIKKTRTIFGHKISIYS
jgi:hypothetical protein